MHGTALLAEHLDSQADAILALWRQTVDFEGDVPEARQLSHAEFRDHVPEILDRLGERLRGLPADTSTEARRHGQVRWRQGYDIAQVVVELGHLRSALRRATFAHAAQHQLALEPLEAAVGVVDEVIDEVIAESVTQYQEENLAALTHARDQATAHGQAVEEARIETDIERAKLGAILRRLPVGVWVVNREGVLVGCNPEAERLQGFPAAEVVGKVNLLHDVTTYPVSRPDGQPLGPGELPIARALGGLTIEPEEILWHQPGGDRIVSVGAAPLFNAAGLVAGAVAAVLDITDRRKAEAELSRHREQANAIFRSLGEGVYAVDRNGDFTFINPAAEQILGWPADELLGRDVHATIHYLRPDGSPYPAAECPLKAAVREGRPLHGDETYVRRDGSLFPVSIVISPIHSGDEVVGAAAAFRDITERRRLDEELAEASRHKSRLLSALSHDARTPLNAIFLSAELLEMHFQERDDPEIDRCLETIRGSVTNVLDLVRDLLDLSKIDAGAATAEVAFFELEPTLAECLSSVTALARQKGLGCRLEPGPLAGLAIETDRSKLKQLLGNLLSNALRYTQRGHIRLFGERPDAERIIIGVEDTGIGIAPADQGKVFQEFARVESSPRHAGEGTGLGLAICRRLADLLGAEITLQSAPGVGSTFRLVLPASLLRDGDDEPDDPPADPAPVSGTIVVAEDHDASRLTLSRVLSRMGYRVLEADNGREALDLARAERPFAVLMDVNMPDMDGVDATLALRADPSTADLPIVALTGDVSPENHRRMVEAGVDGFLEKPITAEAIKQALASLPRRPG